MKPGMGGKTAAEIKKRVEASEDMKGKMETFFFLIAFCLSLVHFVCVCLCRFISKSTRENAHVVLYNCCCSCLLIQSLPAVHLTDVGRFSFFSQEPPEILRQTLQPNKPAFQTDIGHWSVIPADLRVCVHTCF